MEFPIPDTALLPQTNAVTGVGSLMAQADLCLAQQPYAPTFTLVDFYDVGNGSVFREPSSPVLHLMRSGHRRKADF